MSSASLHTDFVLPILVSHQGPRQNYVFDLIFNQLIGIDYELCDKPLDRKFLSYGSLQGELSIYCHDYLYQEGLGKPIFEEGIFDGYRFPFFGDDNAYTFPFDLFSAIFYFVSRHEEYGSQDLDAHGRFKATNSWLFINDWLKTPIVNYLVNELREEIIRVFAIDLPPKDNYKVIPTIDIDNPYAFYGREESLLPSVLKSIASFDFWSVKEKLSAAKDKTLDPFNTHYQIIDFINQETWNPSIFFLMKSGGKNSISSSEAIQEVVRKYKAKAISMGIHPSYNVSFDDLEKEKKELGQVLDQEIKTARYHFIQSVLPQAYQNLIDAEVDTDFSMGYANTNGFRAGICNSFYWFDLQKNEKTALKITPFFFMDATYIFNLKSTPDEALVDMLGLVNEVKKYKGELSFVFHNESLSDTGIYEGWRKVWDNLFGELK